MPSRCSEIAPRTQGGPEWQDWIAKRAPFEKRQRASAASWDEPPPDTMQAVNHHEYLKIGRASELQRYSEVAMPGGDPRPEVVFGESNREVKSRLKGIPQRLKPSLILPAHLSG
jgi:hypothetical protein